MSADGLKEQVIQEVVRQIPENNVTSLFPTIETKNLQKNQSALHKYPFKFLLEKSVSPTVKPKEKASPTFKKTIPQTCPEILKTLRNSKDASGKFLSPKISVRKYKNAKSSKEDDTLLSSDLCSSPDLASFESLSLDDSTDYEADIDFPGTPLQILNSAKSNIPSTPKHKLSRGYKSTIQNKTFLVSSPKPLAPNEIKNFSYISKLIHASNKSNNASNVDKDADVVTIEKLNRVRIRKKPRSNDPFLDQEAKTEPGLREERNVSKSIPFDWSLKSDITFICNKPFKTGYQKQDKDLTSSQTGLNYDDIAPHLVKYIYPTLGLPPSYAKSLPRILEIESSKKAMSEEDIMNIEYHKSMMKQWCDAFESLFDLFIYNAVTSFYYISCDYIALFINNADPSANGNGKKQQDNLPNADKLSGKVFVVLSPATLGTRKRLLKEKIKFDIVPKDGNKGTRDSSSNNSNDVYPPFDGDNNDTDIDNDEVINANRENSHVDRRPVTIVIRDFHSIRRFYKFLLIATEEYYLHKVFSFPKLLSDKVFMNASFQSAKIVKNDKIRYDILDPINRNKIETMHKLKINGTLYPTGMNSLLKHVRLEQSLAHGGPDSDMILTATFTIDEKTIDLNQGYVFAMSLVSPQKPPPHKTVSTIRALLCKNAMVMWK